MKNRKHIGGNGGRLVHAICNAAAQNRPGLHQQGCEEQRVDSSVQTTAPNGLTVDAIAV
jgi:hypothetical protein